jgi:hypothetical protein
MGDLWYDADGNERYDEPPPDDGLSDEMIGEPEDNVSHHDLWSDPGMWEDEEDDEDDD